MACFCSSTASSENLRRVELGTTLPDFIPRFISSISCSQRCSFCFWISVSKWDTRRHWDKKAWPGVVLLRGSRGLKSTFFLFSSYKFIKLFVFCKIIVQKRPPWNRIEGKLHSKNNEILMLGNTTLIKNYFYVGPWACFLINILSLQMFFLH